MSSVSYSRSVRARRASRGQCETAGLLEVSIANRCMVGHCSYYANRADEGLGQIRRALEDARLIGMTPAEIFALESQGLLMAASGDYVGAQEALLAGIPLARKAAGARRYLSMMLWALSGSR